MDSRGRASPQGRHRRRLAPVLAHQQRPLITSLISGLDAGAIGHNGLGLPSEHQDNLCPAEPCAKALVMSMPHHSLGSILGFLLVSVRLAFSLSLTLTSR